MELHRALIEQAPSLALQRAAADRIAQLEEARAKDLEEIYRLRLKVDRLEHEMADKGVPDAAE